MRTTDNADRGKTQRREEAELSPGTRVRMSGSIFHGLCGAVVDRRTESGVPAWCIPVKLDKFPETRWWKFTRSQLVKLP